MTQAFSDMKPELCMKCEDRTPHKRAFKEFGRGQYRPVSATCIKCGTEITYK